MTNEDLKLKVINAQAKVEKKAAILWKHRQQLDKLITKGADDYAIRSKHRDIIREHVTKYRDESTYQAVKRREAREKELLEDVAENWGGLAENWDEIKDTYC